MLKETVKPNQNRYSLYDERSRQGTIDFLKQIDDEFIPPISSESRKGSIEGYLDYLLSPDSRLILRKDDDRVVGIFAYRVDKSKKEIYMTNLSVAKELRNGFAQPELLGQMIANERDKGIERLWFTTWEGNDVVKRTYSKMGFTQFDRQEGDYNGLRTTLSYQMDFADLQRYLDERHVVPVQPLALPEIKQFLVPKDTSTTANSRRISL